MSTLIRKANLSGPILWRSAERNNKTGEGKKTVQNVL